MAKKTPIDVTLMPKLQRGRKTSYGNTTHNAQRKTCAMLFSLHLMNGWTGKDAARDIGYSEKTLRNWRLIFDV